MKKNNISRRRFLLISLIVLSCLLLFAACGDNTDGPRGNGVSAISIADNAKPQTQYAQGQDLDLTKGSLLVVRENGLKENVALNAEGVSVTGYDKNTLGDQSLVITYGGKSISLTVNVAKRMTFSGYETSYFVGDTINTAKGKVAIVKNDGSIISVRLNDPAISVVNFDSAAAGQGKLATIRYSADGVEYTDTIAVNVFDIGNVKFTKPTKSAYGSHETELNLQGGYFTVTAKDNDKLSKHVELSQLSKDMITGFRPSEVTKDHVNDPVTQTITVTYAGNTYNFDVTVIYSGVSIMRDVIEQLKHLDPDAEELKISDTEATAAIEGMVAYLQMTPTDRDQLSQAQVEKIARLCALSIPGYANYLAKPLSGAIIAEYGNIGFSSEITYESAMEVCMILQDPNCGLIEFANFADAFVQMFAELVVREEVTVGQYVRFVKEAGWRQVAAILDIMIQAYDDISVVPDNWTVESLEPFGDAVDTTVRHITNITDKSLVSGACNIVSSWRTNDDYLEIIYTYYYTYLRGMMMEEIWGRIPLPKDLEEIYIQVYNAASFNNFLQSQGAKAIWQDTSYMFLYHYKALELAEKLMNGEHQLSKDLYNFINFDQLIKDYTVYAPAGLVNLMSAGYSERDIAAVMDIYVQLLLQASNNGGSLSFDEYRVQFQALFEGFASLTPSKQTAFLNSLYYQYSIENVRDRMVLSFAEDGSNGIFMTFLQGYFKNYLPEEMQGIAQDMLLAMEYYMNKDRYDDAMAKFMEKMEQITEANANLHPDQKILFNQYLGAAYTKYNLLYNFEKNGTTIDQELYINQFSALVDAIRNYQSIRENMVEPETSIVKEGMLGLVISAFTRVESIAREIMDLNNAEIDALYATLQMEITAEQKMHLDYAYMNARYSFLVMMHSISFTSTKEDGTQNKVFAWELYHEGNVSAIMYELYHVMMSQYNGSQMDPDVVMATMKAIRNVMNTDIDSLYLVTVLDGDTMYYKGLQTFFEGVLSESNQAIGTKLLEVERALCKYAFGGAKNEEDKAAFVNAMEELIALYGAVTDTENFNTYLGEMYNYYLETYNHMKDAA